MTFLRLLRTSLVIGATVLVCVCTSCSSSTSSPFRQTRIHVITPFRIDGHPLGVLHERSLPGVCEPGSRVVLTNVYTCTTSNLASDSTCQKCTFEVCWRDFSRRQLSLVCLLNPTITSTTQLEEGDEYRIRPINHPLSASRFAQLFRSEPWGIRLSTDERCNATAASGKNRRSRPPVLLYACGQGRNLLIPVGRVDRSRRIWTIRTYGSLQQLSERKNPLSTQITDAWFAGNSS